MESKTSITARIIKEGNPGVFAGVPVKTVSRLLHELRYNSYKRTKKPLITEKQRVNMCNFAKKNMDSGLTVNSGSVFCGVMRQFLT